MKFKSDSQRKAIFSRLNNRFALYIKDNHIRSTVYPQVDVEIRPRKSHIKSVISGLVDEDERNLAGVNSISMNTLYGGTSGLYDMVTNDVDLSSSLHPLDARSVLRHELAHHIDDEVTPEKYTANRAYFEDFADDMSDKKLTEHMIELDDEFMKNKAFKATDFGNNKIRWRKSLERHESADALKDLSTPTFDELIKYAGKKDAQHP